MDKGCDKRRLKHLLKRIFVPHELLMYTPFIVARGQYFFWFFTAGATKYEIMVNKK